MAVPVRNRSQAANAFRYKAIQLQKDMTLLLLRDFGVKSKEFSIDYYSKINKMSAEDQELFTDILARYNLTDHLVASYPAWLLDYYRKNILATLHELCSDLTMIVSMEEKTPVSNLKEFYCRQQYANHAVGSCQELLQEMQDVLSVLPVNANKLMPYTEHILELRKLVMDYRNKTNADKALFDQKPKQ